MQKQNIANLVSKYEYHLFPYLLLLMSDQNHFRTTSLKKKWKWELNYLFFLTKWPPWVLILCGISLGLNMLQSGLHKQHMKDLFVELCLTVPVRLSSLLPYLPMLMDPLVSALNGSQTLVSQGLRTLELCVDNLQPDFLYDHIQPVRAELMQVKPLTCYLLSDGDLRDNSNVFLMHLWTGIVANAS